MAEDAPQDAAGKHGDHHGHHQPYAHRRDAEIIVQGFRRFHRLQALFPEQLDLGLLRHVWTLLSFHADVCVLRNHRRFISNAHGPGEFAYRERGRLIRPRVLTWRALLLIFFYHTIVSFSMPHPWKNKLRIAVGRKIPERRYAAGLDILSAVPQCGRRYL